MQKLNETAQKIYRELCAKADSWPSGSSKAIAFVSEIREGVIAFYGEDLIELSITDCLSNQNIFWLHMQVEQKEALRDSLMAFFDVLESGLPKDDIPNQSFAGRKPYKVVVVCTTGMSSQLFANMLQEEADLLQIPARFSAKALNDLLQEDQEYDWILTAPQINHEYPKIHDKFGDKAMKISPREFGTLNVNKVLETLLEKENSQ